MGRLETKRKRKGKQEKDGLDDLLRGITAGDGDSWDGMETERDILDARRDVQRDVPDARRDTGKKKKIARNGVVTRTRSPGATIVPTAQSGVPPDVPAAASAPKYVPRLQRAQHSQPGQHDTEDTLRLRKQLLASLNRLSEANIASILSDIQSLYQTHPRAHVTSCLTELILASITSRAHLLDTFVILHAAFVTAVYRIVGTDFAAHFIQTTVESFHHYYSTTSSKEPANLVVLLTKLYTFQSLGCPLIYDLIRMFLDAGIDEVNVELLLKMLRNCGSQLRADDPSALKEIILSVQQKVGQLDPKSVSSRTRFLLETLSDLRNNKGNSSSIVAAESATRMKKFLGTLGHAREPIRVSLQNINDIETKGKWWLVGASWKEDEHQQFHTNTLPHDTSLLQLAKEQGMNTDVRKAIFATIMSSEDYVDACEKLVKLKLKRGQEPEIPRVLVHCCGSEESYNAYYTLIAKRLCAKHSLRTATQFAVWGVFQQMAEDPPMRKVINLARFTGELFADGFLPLAMTKVLNLLSLDRSTEIFLEIALITMFSRLETNGLLSMPEMEKLYTKVAENQRLQKGLLWFLTKRVGESDMVAPDQVESVRVGVGLSVDILTSMVVQ